MIVEDIEREVRGAAARWAFVQQTETVDRTDYTVKMRLHLDIDCFIQIYANTQKELISYALIFNRSRIFGRDCDGGVWHRHPAEAPDQHDFSREGQRTVSLDEFLKEAQQVLVERGIL